MTPWLVRIYSFFIITLLFRTVVAVLLMRLFALVHTKATRRESNPTNGSFKTVGFVVFKNLNNEYNRALRKIRQRRLTETSRFQFLESLFYFEFVDKTFYDRWEIHFFECLPKETYRSQFESQKHGFRFDLLNPHGMRFFSFLLCSEFYRKLTNS